MEFEVPTNDQNKCTEFKPFKTVLGFIPYPHCGASKKTNPHMRAFWAATMAFMMAFIGWFAFAPLLFVVRKDIGICDNNDEVQADIENVDCVCKVSCKATINNANIASVLFDVFTRFILGAVIERLGPVNTDVILLLWGVVVLSASATVTNGTGLIIVRFFVSALGSTFVVNQFWNSIMFAPNVIGTANATAGGWGNLGGGLTQTIMPLVYRFFHDALGLSLSASWRAAMFVPATIFLILAVWIYFCSQDMTTGKFQLAALGKTKKANCSQYFECLKDYRVVLMIFQYSACFGCELVFNNKLALHFSDFFGIELVYAGILATSFGAMNLFARSLGGIASDWASARIGMMGRLWVHFFSLLGQAIFVFGFGCVTQDMGWPWALFMLVMMAIFVNMAEGTSYGIVPYMIPQHLAIVSAVVGAGGTAGAVIALNLFYRPAWVPDPLDQFKLHSAYILFWTLTVPLMTWPHLGSMFHRPASEAQEAKPPPVEPAQA
jgi:NNP family nitrate/nitrite transporter-like MFS transporter